MAKTKPEPVEEVVEKKDVVERIVIEKAIKVAEETFEQRKERTSNRLFVQKKVPVFIPKTKGEKAGAALPVQINGVRFLIKKGEMVEVPEDVARLVMESVKEVDQESIARLMSTPSAGNITIEKN